MSKLISIVPRLAPSIDGVGDYALSLARQLRDNFGIESCFIVCDPDWSGGDALEGFPTHRLAGRHARELLSGLSGSKDSHTALLHYVGYGYAGRGAPLWLIDGLERWRGNSNGARLLTIFHEVYASGPFWTSAFWLSSTQKHLAARLARLSDCCLTSMQHYAEIISTLSRNKHDSITAFPVFSNIGEPEQTPPLLKDRKRRLVVFGGCSNRLRVYENSLKTLEEVCRALAVEEVFDVGPPTDSKVCQVSGVNLTRIGKRSAAEVRSILSDSIAGFFNYNTGFLAKSTIFAAYSAHRLIPISASSETGRADGLEAGRHYWAADSHGTTLNLESGQEIADNAYAWYRTHDLSVQAKSFASHLDRFTSG